MRINSDKVIKALGLRNFGSKGWKSSPDTKCPVCNRSEKFGILFTPTGGVTHCFFECGDNLSLYHYLKKIGRDDLVEFDNNVSIECRVPELKSNVIETKELDEVKLPKGLKRVHFDEYLQERGFRDYHYERFEVSITDHFLEKKLWNNLIFIIKQNDRKVAWLSRSKNSKEWHKNNLERFKEGFEELVLRYRNSEKTDFECILGGYDQITDNTHTIIAVEGIFDYINLSNLLETEKSEEVRIVFTFGDSFSNDQIQLLRKKRSVERVILFYDFGTVKQSKHYGLELSKYFEVEVCYVEEEGVDPGNIDKKLLLRVLKNTKNILYFYSSRIATKIKIE